MSLGVDTMNQFRISWDGTPRSCVLQPPVSKSDAIRIQLLRYARGESPETISSPVPDDLRSVMEALKKISSGQKRLYLNLGLGAAPCRFLLATACMIPGMHTTINIPPRLRKRPHKPLLRALKQSLAPYGLVMTSEGWPVVIDTKDMKLPDKIHFSVKPTSSQYVSALALASASAIAGGLCRTARIELQHKIAGSGYSELTAHWLREAGFRCHVSEKSWVIDGFTEKVWEPVVPDDWSSISYLIFWAWKSDSVIRSGDNPLHPDSAVVDILNSAGMKIHSEQPGLLRVTGNLERGIKASARQCPDIIPTLAVAALTAPGESQFEDVGTLQDKESDRIAFIMDMAAAVGGRAVLEEGVLRVFPTDKPPETVTIFTENDHRRAMAGSLLLAFGWPEVLMDNPACVSKSFPLYWDTIRNCGVQMEKTELKLEGRN